MIAPGERKEVRARIPGPASAEEIQAVEKEIHSLQEK
jgi:hypothetical protein